MEIAYTCFENGEWGNPVSIQNELNNRRSSSPYYFDQNDTVLFYHAETDSGYGEFDIWAIRFENGDWGNPYNLGPTINTFFTEGYPSMPDDGSRLYFYRHRSIMYSDIINGQFADPVMLPDYINCNPYVSSPRISRDGQKLYFSRRPAWANSVDSIFVSYYINGEWQEPLALNENINFNNNNPFCTNPYRFGSYSPTFPGNGAKMYFSHFELEGTLCDPIDKLMVSELITDINDDSPEGPSAFSLSAYPNPFNSTTNISISGNLESVSEIAIYDIVGRRMKTFAPAAIITWDGTDSRGVPVSSGIYFIKATAGSLEESLRITLIK
ncbi:MAG: T9SS type A sorting domain-containing protein [Candidatus Zixiibacteriota bacterium]|nr:MAG: T9SS type A sorting domain-containing protein [candidate division Zixibacteria bacterium]